MGYHVKVEELHTALRSMRSQIEQWQEQLSQVQISLNTAQFSAAIKGETGDNIRSYVAEVQVPLVKAIKQALTEFDMKVTLYVEGYSGVDESDSAELLQDRFESVGQLLQQELTQFQSLYESVNQTIAGVADIVEVSYPKSADVNDGYTQIVTFAQELDTTVGEYEESHKLDSQSVEELLSTIQIIISSRSGIGVTASGYVPGSCVMNPAYSTLREQMETSTKYTNKNQKFYTDILSVMNPEQEILMESSYDEVKSILSSLGVSPDSVMSILSSAGKNSKDVTMLIDGVRFNLNKIGDKYYVQLSGSITEGNFKKWDTIEKSLKTSLRDQTWSKYDMKTFVNKGIQPSDEFWEGTKYENLQSYVGNIDNARGNKFTASKTSFIKNFGQNINILDDFKISKYKNLDKLEIAGKGLGAAGSIWTTADNVKDNLFVNGELHITTDRVQDTITDTSVDFLAGAGAQALGTAIGSFFFPPLGTAVGVVAGFAIDAAINCDLKDVNGDGKKDSLVDMAKIGLDSACDEIGNFFGKIF